jgi:hypothetical protein
MNEHAKAHLQIEVILFEFDGTVIGKYPKSTDNT